MRIERERARGFLCVPEGPECCGEPAKWRDIEQPRGFGYYCGKHKPNCERFLQPSQSTAAVGFENRKEIPLATGLVDYFPDALVAVAKVSLLGNKQHHKDKPLFWDRSKSTDEADALMRHFVDRGRFDSDGARHSAKVAWRALALLQKEIENAR